MEFVEVMRQWKRRCEHCDAKENVHCYVHGYTCSAFNKMKNFTNFKSVEEEIMKWAAENPEPQYPTWWEWLFSIGAVTRKVKPDVAATLIDTGLLDHIHADMAKKLGIAPKEVNHGT